MEHAADARAGYRVLLVGSGGREHALAWKLAQSPLLERLWAAPGNPGVAKYAECVDVAAEDVAGLVRFARDRRCDLVVVGPEDPLAAGLVDALAEAGVRAFGPTRAAARLEASKDFARALAAELGVPGPRAAAFTDFEAARAHVRDQGAFPVAIKADGLYRGKGVVLAADLAEAEAALAAMLRSGAYGDAGRAVVVQEFLHGEERSYMALCDGERALLMPPAQDHKRAYDGDQGPNTGGMGAVAPAWRPGDPTLEAIEATFFQPVLRAMRERGTPFRGVLFAGVMLTVDGPKLLEYNARFGDPETEALLPLLEDDLLPLLLAVADGDLRGRSLHWRPGACVTVVLASGGYPGAYRTGLPIRGLDSAAAASGALIFHAGTAAREGRIVTHGGRVLCVAGTGATLGEADARAYEAVQQVRWDGVQYRSDIGGAPVGSAAAAGKGGVHEEGR